MVSLSKPIKASITALLLISGSTNAAIFTHDFFGAGDNLLIRDSATNLEWMKLSLTEGVAVSQVLAGYRGFTSTSGFHLATRSEVTSLLGSFGLSIRGDFTLDDVPEAQNFTSTFGVTFPYSNGGASMGYIEQTSPMTGGIDALLVGETTTVGGASWLSLATRYYASGHQDYGSFLTRAYVPVPEPKPVPEPTTGALTILAFATLLAARGALKRP